MTPEKILEVVVIYRKKLESLKINPSEFPEDLLELFTGELFYDEERGLKLLSQLRNEFENDGISKKQLLPEVYNKNFVERRDGFLITRPPEEILSHCYWMLDEMEQFIQQGCVEKMFRWFGFILGCFLASEYSIATTLEICHSAIYKTEEIIRERQKEKMFILLGLVQGSLLCCGVYTLNELRNHNRQNDETAA